MKNSNEGNKKIVPLSDEELQQATGGKTGAELMDELCNKLSRSGCSEVTVCGWFDFNNLLKSENVYAIKSLLRYKTGCYGRIAFPVPDLLE